MPPQVKHGYWQHMDARTDYYKALGTPYARKKLRTPRKRFNRVRTQGKEVKFRDDDLDAAALSVTWDTVEDATMDCIGAVAQGNTGTSRVGRVYYIRSVHLRGSISTLVADLTAPPDEILCKLMLIIDKQTNGVQVTATDVMEATQTQPIFAYRNLEQAGRFTVLWSRTFRVVRKFVNEGAVNLVAVAALEIPFHVDHVFKTPLKVVTCATTAVVASLTENSIHMIGVTTDVAARCAFQARVRFTD